MKKATTRAALVLMCMLSLGCSTINGARPLASGEHEIGLILGGPMVKAEGGAIPLPNGVISVRSGLPRLLDRPFEIDYGVNLIAATFRIGQTHLGVSWQLTDQAGGVPALTLTDRFYLATEGSSLWVVNQQELLLSWLVGNHLIYTGIGNYVDFGNLSEHPLRLTPLVGAAFDPFEKGGSRFHIEVRWFAVNKTPEIEAVEWLPPQRGALGLSFGFSYQL